ncbi:MAG: GNAT family N-acetyltransferase [Bacteroidales bacterium]|nr:GNAT family N-acetyltransferase [Bacteroidales bacterium]MCR5697120.1 GNAT family N-acetyltransferase [Marinilabiliaceae bacterium]
MSEPIIEPVSREELERELTQERFVRTTNKGNNKIFDFSAQEAPALMREVGRLREIAFRMAGGGTGKSTDIDEYDVSDIPFRQLIVWDPDEREILGGYRYILCKNLPKSQEGTHYLATSHMFHFTEKFINEYFPQTIELGRSFVQPLYQSSKAGAKSIYALDNLWDGLGSLVVDNKDVKYFFGKVTMYTHFNQQARDYILGFWHKFFGDKERLVYAYKPISIGLSEKDCDEVFNGKDFKENYMILVRKVRECGEHIPPLVNAYMTLSPSMKVYDTAINDEFGDVEETGILINLHDLYESKAARHINTYKQKQ